MSARHRHASEMTLIDQLLAEQQQLTAVERFSALHERGHVQERYSALLPATPPGPGEQYAFEVNLDACTGCKACVAACHSLNGLDATESFRDVGLLIGDGYQQTVTTACHHCEDPACANGCPVQAYEKDADTGIVKHLDDQCIGCQYCMLKCPYEVPKWNDRLGIVRKCDMCAQRLAVGEAPACVQACPTSAIRIVKRRTGILPVTSAAGILPDVGGLETRRTGDRQNACPTSLLPDTITSTYTQPTTTYSSSRSMPADARAADRDVLRVQPTHWPLVLMLVLTQLSVGLMIGAIWHVGLLWTASGALFAGLGVSVLHLGRPLGAWRFFLGLRKSWMSREILAFSVLAGSALGSFVLVPVTLSAVLGLVAVFTSAMIYIDTQRAWWSGARISVSFFGTVAKLGASGTAAITGDAVFTTVALLSGALFWLAETRVQRGCDKSLRVVTAKLSGIAMAKRVLAVTAMVCQAMALAFPAWAWVLGSAAFACSLIACVCERVIFFKAVDAPKMPGGLTA
ncbi:MAG: hypothetical protein JNM99_10400 [Verrucomicrobiaceae bacterium]|nr:hypothetical protein [Verrucomicrobiaceae bacterium]